MYFFTGVKALLTCNTNMSSLLSDNDFCPGASFEPTSLAESESGSYACSLADDSCSTPPGDFLHLLPSEVIFYICSFLEAKFLLQTASLVCKRFYHILLDAEFWRARLRERWRKKYPPVPGEVFASWLVLTYGTLIHNGSAPVFMFATWERQKKMLEAKKRLNLKCNSLY